MARWGMKTSGCRGGGIKISGVLFYRKDLTTIKLHGAESVPITVIFHKVEVFFREINGV
jgi:hypothetical protein